MTTPDKQTQLSNGSLAGRLLLLATVMFAFGVFALPPMYDVFCEITGFAGRTNSQAVVAEEAPDMSREIRIEFVTVVNNHAPWDFTADVDSMTVHPGKMYFATFTATNRTSKELVGQAVPSVAPVTATEHFRKIECFCFSSQEFAGNEQRALPLQFIVDPELPDYVDTITLSYTFFNSVRVSKNSAL